LNVKKRISFFLILILYYFIEDKCYEVVLTTYDGFYRYRTEDIIKVTEHYYALPTWQIIGRFVKETNDFIELYFHLDVVNIYQFQMNM